jgi:hypothetical protein
MHYHIILICFYNLVILQFCLADFCLYLLLDLADLPRASDTVDWEQLWERFDLDCDRFEWLCACL